MKTLHAKINFDTLGLSKTDLKNIQEIGWRAVFEMYLTAGLQAQHERGVPLSKGRILNRILTKLDAAGDDGVVSLEDAEWDLVYGCFTREESVWQPAQYRILCAIIDVLEKEKLKSQKEKDGAGSSPS